jgi:hypothetical protein
MMRSGLGSLVCHRGGSTRRIKIGASECGARADIGARGVEGFGEKEGPMVCLSRVGSQSGMSVLRYYFQKATSGA